MTIMAENPVKAHSIFNNVVTQAKIETRAHDLVTRLRFHSLGRRFLNPGKLVGQELIAQAPTHPSSLDKIDHQILEFIIHKPWKTIRDVAHGAQLPPATADRRLKHLEQRGVIVGYRYILNLHHFGASIYKVLVLLGRQDQSAIETLEKIARNTPVVSSFCQSFGSWDFEFNLETPNASDIPALVQTLYDQLGNKLQDTRVLPLFEFFKSGSFPKKGSTK
jgi:DNA-binding Lrp family transcriptional regulator